MAATVEEAMALLDDLNAEIIVKQQQVDLLTTLIAEREAAAIEAVKRVARVKSRLERVVLDSEGDAGGR